MARTCKSDSIPPSRFAVESTASLISAVTEAVMDEVTAWQNRPLEPRCPVVFMDAIRVNIRADGAVANKAVLVAPAILPDGTRDVLFLWFQANTSAASWRRPLKGSDPWLAGD